MKYTIALVKLIKNASKEPYNSFSIKNPVSPYLKFLFKNQTRFSLFIWIVSNTGLLFHLIISPNLDNFVKYSWSSPNPYLVTLLEKYIFFLKILFVKKTLFVEAQDTLVPWEYFLSRVLKKKILNYKFVGL